MQRSNRLFVLAVLVAIPAVATPALAAPITWSPAFEVATDADIRIDGRNVVYAINGGSNQPLTGNVPVTIGSRTLSFEGVSIAQPGTFNAPTYGDVTDHLAGQNFPVTFSVVSDRPETTSQTIPFASFDPGEGARTTYGIPTGNAGLDVILNSQIWTNGRRLFNDTVNPPSKFIISLNNLTPGTAYQVQVIANADSRAANAAYTYLISDTVTAAVPGLAGAADLNGDTVKHVTSILGDFTASASTQSIGITIATTNGRNPGISALILTTVPEPTTATLLLPALTLLARRRPRR